MFVIPVGHDQPTRTFAWITAIIMAACVLIQIEKQLVDLYDETHGAGDHVAYSAHVGGFAFGAAVALLVRWSGLEARFLLPAMERTVRRQRGQSGRIDADFEAALAALGRDDRAGALALLKQIIARNPRHPGAQLELCRLGLALGERAYPRVWGWEVIIHQCERRRFADARDLYGAITAQWPELVPSAEAQLALLRAALAASDLALALRLAERLPMDHPRSSLAPAALLEFAEAMSAAGRPDLAERQLRRLVDLYPADRFAVRARELLGPAAAQPLDDVAIDIETS